LSTFLGIVLFCLVAGWVLYPLIIAAMARQSELSRARTVVALDEPTVSVVVATREPPEILRERIADLMLVDYPAEQFTIIVSLDPLGPYSLQAYREVVGEDAEIVAGDEPGGKAATLNAAVRASQAEIIVFADSHQAFNRQAIRSLVGLIQTGIYAGASGVVDQGSEGSVDRWYRKFDLAIRRAQAARWSLVTTSGAIAAIRRDAWRPLRPGLICDDLFMAMQLGMRGERVGLCEEARASDPRVFTHRQQFQRRVRTLTGLIQFIVWYPSVLLPWRNRYWGHFMFHKILRLATPYLVVTAIGVSAWLAGGGVWTWWLPALGLLGGAVLALSRGGRRVVVQMGWAVSLLAAPIVAMAYAACGRWAVWPQHQSRESG